MRGIASALKRQRLRRIYPQGVNISHIIQSGLETYYAELTNLKNGHTFRVVEYKGYLAMLPAVIRRDALINGFRDAGIVVEENFIPRADKIMI